MIPLALARTEVLPSIGSNLLLIEGNHSPKVAAMNTLPISRASFEPRRHIEISYLKLDSESDTPAIIRSLLSFNTSRPCVHLDNILQISAIECTSGSITVHWQDQLLSRLAFKLWSTSEKLALLTAHEHNCNGLDAGTFGVDSMALDGYSIHISTTKLQRKDVMSDFEIDLDHYMISKNYNENIDKLNELTNGFLQKMDSAVFETILHRRKVTSQTLRMRLLRFIRFLSRWDDKHYFNTVLNWNYNQTTNTTKNPVITIIGNMTNVLVPRNSIACIDCYTFGRADIRSHFRGSSGVISYYYLTVVGELKGKLDLSAKVYLIIILALYNHHVSTIHSI